MDGVLSCPVCNRTFKDMRGETAQESIILNHILACSSSGGKLTPKRSPTICRTTRSSSQNGMDKEKRGRTCLPSKRPLRFSSHIDNTNDLPIPIPPSKRSYNKATKDTSDHFAKRSPKSSSKRTKQIISSPRTVTAAKRPHHSLDFNETSKKIPSCKKLRRNNNNVKQQQREAPGMKLANHAKRTHHSLDSNETSKKKAFFKKLRRNNNNVEQKQRKIPDINLANHDEGECNKGRRKGAVIRTCPLCKRVFHMSRVSPAEVASHISRCCDANFPIRKQVTNEPKKRRVVPPDDAIEVRHRIASLQFLRGGSAKRTLEDITLCYLNSI